MRACSYSNLSKKEQKSLEELKHKEDIVIVNAGKGDAVVLNNVKSTSKNLKDN